MKGKEENWKSREERKNGLLPISGSLSQQRSSEKGRNNKWRLALTIAHTAGVLQVRPCVGQA